ncbi:MAG: lipopolysaccharide kinase InaA family protein [Candidatus Accumulibacter sp.]|jgi:tRNA A-37 threonylcarbamoyl transferase component Bud32|nr:lipopolysaccharide kinase InaA family protein [Accumulibacter sp.]
MSYWRFDPEANGGVAGRAFASLEQVFALAGERITKAPLGEVVRVECEGRRYYVKRYAGNGKNARKRWFGLRQWLAPPRVEAEWRNLLAFREWGIPTARLMACGVERRCGGFRRGALVTEEIRDAPDLARLAQENDARLRDGRWVAQVSAQIARIARILHDAGFAHNDLKWRNLLVGGGEAPVVYAIDCPNGGFWWGPFLRYRVVKDLACLDKLAQRHLTRGQRLRFYLDYTGHARLDEDDKRRVRRIVHFFAGRE